MIKPDGNGIYPMRMRRRQLTKGLIDLIRYVSEEDMVMVEIGSYQGESTELFCQADNINKIYAVDPWANGYDPEESVSVYSNFRNVERAFDFRTKRHSKVSKMKMTSEEAVQHFDDKSVDLVYIDGDHRYEYVSKDIELWLPKTRKYIAGHDFLIDDVNRAVKEKLGTPDKTFQDGSWVFLISP